MYFIILLFFFYLREWDMCDYIWTLSLSSQPVVQDSPKGESWVAH